jgi:hypothetical protein
VEILMQPDLFWAIVSGGCFIALALIVIPKDAGVLKDREIIRLLSAHALAIHKIAGLGRRPRLISLLR